MTANLSYPGCQVPGPQLRLAGTFRTAPQLTPDQLAADLPPLDGVHLYLHRDGWLTLSSFLMLGGVTHAISPDSVIADALDPDLHAQGVHLWGVDST
jgi:hypothetical protein